MKLLSILAAASAILLLSACGGGDEPSGLICPALYRAAHDGQVLTVEQRTDLCG